MTVIRPNSISGITSITAQSSTLEYYDSDGNTLTVTGNLNGNVNSSGVSTFSQLSVDAGGINVAGIITASSLYTTSINGGPISGSRNRIINGDMRIDQRNDGATLTSSSGYSVDRWQTALAAGAIGDISYGRSSTSPSGFQYSLLHTVTTAHAAASNDFLLFQQFIEGLNVDDLNFGSSDAKTITVSFWVRCSITGTYSVAVSNGSNNRSYTTTFVVNSADTFEYKQITIPGDTSGTWITGTGKGLSLKFDLGSGSNFVASSTDSWVSTDTFKASGSNSLASNNGATLYITGVQLEVGESATPFEHRSYGQELALCQRYCQSFNGRIAIGNWNGGTSALVMRPLNPPMRATPSIYSYTAGNCLVEAVAWYTVGSVSMQGETTNSSVTFQLSSIANSGQSANNNAVWGNGAAVVIQSEL